MDTSELWLPMTSPVPFPEPCEACYIQTSMSRAAGSLLALTVRRVGRLFALLETRILATVLGLQKFKAPHVDLAICLTGN
jgi:hypothetical protein